MNRWANNFSLIFFCILQFGAVLFVGGQPAGGIFYHLTSKNGLSSNRANMVIQDQEGFYWIATQDGLNRFDGSTCKVFRNIKNDSTSLSHNNCVWLLEDDQADIWVATPRGLNRYIKKEGRFERHYLSHPNLSFDQVNSIRGMVKDEQGNIWVVAAGLWKYNIYTRQWTRYLHNPDDPASIPAGFHSWLQYDKINRGLWMSNSGLTFFEIATGKFYHAGHNPGNNPMYNMIIADGSFILDSMNTIWFYKYPGDQLCNYSTTNHTISIFSVKNLSGGIYSCSVDGKKRIWFNHWFKNTQIFDPALNKFENGFLAYYHQQSPLAASATHLYIDSTGNYWISSANGVSIYNPRAQGVRYFLLGDNRKRDQGLDNAITCLAEQNEDILWVGTAAALYRYDLAQKKVEAIENLRISSTYIRCLYLQNDSILWIGCWNELLLYDLQSKKVLKKIRLNASPQFITSGHPGQIWIGTWFNGLLEFSASGKLLRRIIQGPHSSVSLRYNGLTCFANSLKEPCMWIGYNFENGFFKFGYEDRSIENLKIPTRSPHINTSNSVNAIAEDRKGNLWLGTGGGGLVYFDRQNNSYTTYSPSDGLKGDYVNNILQDAYSNTWVTTSNGLSIIDARTNSIINSEIDLAFGNSDFVANGIRRKNGRLLFFSGLKIVEIDPVLYLQSAYPSRILLSSFKIFEKETSLAKNNTGQTVIDLSYRQNFFSFEYSLLKPNPETGTQYTYRLEGFDKDWNNVRERRTAYYTNVPPGSYHFQVKATDESGKWVYFSKPLAITISPPFWRTWWFITIAVTAVVAGLYIFYRYRISQVKRLFGLRSKISQDLHDEVASTLSGIRLYSELAKQQLNKNDFSLVHHSLEVISANSSEMKEAMSDIVWAINPANDSFGKLLQKLKSYATELAAAKNLRFQLEINENLPEEKLSMQQRRNIYLICKEAVNNAVKYSGGETLDINVKRQDHSIRIGIKDNGVGFEPKNKFEGNGLLNMRLRSDEIGASLNISSMKDEGTEIELLVRL